ncbi:hypothetical protein ABFS82_13G007400 [Erythranthe guttata]
MGCFFGCFRIKNPNSNLITPRENVTSSSKNALSSLFVCDDDSVRKGEEGRKTPAPVLDVSELKIEAKFVKTCETLPETPVEIRKTLDKWEDKSAQNKEEKSVEFDSWLPDSSIEKPKLEKQSDASPRSGSTVDSSSSHSCMTDGGNTGRVSNSPVRRRDFQNVITTTMHMSDSETHSETSSVTSRNFPPSAQCESSDSNHLREQPLKLNDEDNEDVNSESSLSSWFKPVSDKRDCSNEESGSVYGKKVHKGKTPKDRPIIGMVAAHWNDDVTTHISPKWWDGNGIPNSTNKYKEDQKVSWHATPFEERLEKALSEETFISQSRKTTSGKPPLEFKETEECDTALSHLQPSAHIKSVVSF